MMNTPIRKGVYKHFKGKLYRVLGEGFNTETMEMYVIYEPLYENEFNLFVRPKWMFLETLPNGMERFKFVREEYES